MKTGVRFLALFALAASLGAPARLHADPWIETAQLFHSGGSVGDLFGSSVALDGDVAVVGQPSPETGNGVARVFLRSGGSWSEVAALSASDGAIGDSFGASVAISGDTIVVGAPVAALADTPDEGKVYLFERPAGGWSGNLFETAQLGNFDFTVIGPDRLGSSVSISGDTVAAGAPGSAFETDGATDRGVVFVFTRPRSGWSSRNAPSAILDAAAGVAGDQLGYSVGISGNTVVAGAPGTSIDAYVWVEPQSGWAGILGESAVLTPANPILTFNGLPHWVYGGAVAIDGPTIVVTAPYGSYQDPDFGSVPVSFLFEEPTSGWSGTLNETAWLVPDEDKGGNVIFDFGQSVSISSDTVVVGEPGLTVFPFSFDDGGAFIFRKPSSGWSGKVGQYANILRVDNSERGSMFGRAVSISGASILVGAPQEPVGGHLSQGAAHVFEPGLDPVVTASFSPGSVLTHETSTLTLTITNPNASGFLWRLHTRTSTFAAGLAIDAVPSASTTCAGGGVFPGGGPGDTALGLDGGGPLLAGTSCTVSANVSSPLPGTFATAASAVSCDQGCDGVGSVPATLLVRLRATQTRFLVQGPIRVAPGVPVELRFQVESRPESSLPPSGEVVVSDGAGADCRGDVSADGEGSCTLTFGARGAYAVRATYLGDLSFGGSTSPPANVFVR